MMFVVGGDCGGRFGGEGGGSGDGGDGLKKKLEMVEVGGSDENKRWRMGEFEEEEDKMMVKLSREEGVGGGDLVVGVWKKMVEMVDKGGGIGGIWRGRRWGEGWRHRAQGGGGGGAGPTLAAAVVLPDRRRRGRGEGEKKRKKEKKEKEKESDGGELMRGDGDRPLCGGGSGRR